MDLKIFLYIFNETKLILINYLLKFRILNYYEMSWTLHSVSFFGPLLDPALKAVGRHSSAKEYSTILRKNNTNEIRFY
jgi:hypothetical protein